MTSAISFNKVSLNFGGVKALTDVSFDIPKNSLFAIIGPNGAGKTSIFNCIGGIYRPTSGNIEVLNNKIDALKPDDIANLGVARTFQKLEMKKTKHGQLLRILLIF